MRIGALKVPGLKTQSHEENVCRENNLNFALQLLQVSALEQIESPNLLKYSCSVAYHREIP